MSLTPEETIATREELLANFKIADVSIEQIALDLNTSSSHVQRVLDLDPDLIEEPWILRNYLNSIIEKNGDKPLPYSRLKGSPLKHWFLDQRFIRENKLVKERD